MRDRYISGRSALAARATAVICGRRAEALLSCALLAALTLAVVLALLNALDILQGVGLGDPDGDPKNGGNLKAGDDKPFSGIDGAINKLRGPATATVAGVGSLGVAAGGIMIGAGSQKGAKVLGCGAGALVAIGLGNGVIE